MLLTVWMKKIYGRYTESVKTCQEHKHVSSEVSGGAILDGGAASVDVLFVPRGVCR